MTTLTPRQRTWFTVAGLVLATVLCYLPLWNAQFLNVDDHHYVTENAVVQQGVSWNGVVWAFESSHVANYHPVTWLSHMLDCSLFGVSPRGHHATNLLIHALNVVLLFLILRWLTGRHWAAAFVACVFAIHPQHVESVAWIAERKDVLSGMFWLLAIAAYAWYVRGAAEGAWWRYGLAMVLLALGLLSKAMVVTLPCVLLLLDVWPLGRTKWVPPARGDDDHAARQRSVGSLLLEKVPMLLLALGCSVATFFAQRRDGAVMTIDKMPVGLRLVNCVIAYARYARKFLWPSDLAAFYPMPYRWPVATFVACLALLIVVTAAILWLSRRRPYLGVGWLWFLGTLVPVIGLVQVGSQSLADRYMYLPMIGLLVMVAWLAAEWWPRVGTRVMTGVASVLLAACALLTAHDVRAWQNSEKLFTQAMARTEPNVFSLRNVAAYLIDHGQPERAVDLLRQSLALGPSSVANRRSLGYALRMAKRYDEAIDEYQVACNLAPDAALNWNGLGHVFADQQKWDAAALQYERAVHYDPADYDSWNNLAVAHHQAGHIDRALADLRGALRANDRIAQPWYMMGCLMLESNRPADAIEPLRHALALNPRQPDAHLRLGVALMRSGHGEQAVPVLIQASNLSPGSPEPMVRLAWLLSTHPSDKLRRGGDALFLAERANEMTRSASPEVLDILAAAQAEQQQFAQAAETAEKARALAERMNAPELAKKAAEHAEKYRAKEPLRDESLAGADAGAAVP